MNTDAQDLKHSKAKQKIQIGLNLTKVWELDLNWILAKLQPMNL